MTQTLAASLIAPDRPGLALGYRILTLAGANYSALIVDEIVEDNPPSGNYRINGGIVAPLPGGFLQWWRVSGGVGQELLAVIAIPPAPALTEGTDFAGLKAAVWTRQAREGWPNGPLAGY